MKVGKYIMVLLVFASAVVTLAGDATRKATTKRWSDYNYISISSSNDRNPMLATISITPSDMLVDFWRDELHRDKAGSLVLTHDRFFAVSGLQLESPNEFAPLKSVLMNYTLIIKLLSQASAGGPNSIIAKTDIHFQEPKKDIIISIPGSKFRVAAPWQVDGQLIPSEKNGFSYKLTLAIGQAKDELQILRFSGVIEYKDGLASDLPESFSLAQWTAYEIRQTIEVHLGEQRMAYWAHALNNTPTLGDLRKHVDSKP